MKKLIILFGILIILTSSVFGFGVTDWLTGPVNVAPGGSKEVVFELQNMLGNEDIVANAQIKEGSDIATIKEGNEIDIPFGVKKEVHILVNVPEDYSEGEYPIIIQFLSGAAKGNGPVQINTGITKSFGVVVNKNAPVSEVPAEQEKTNFGNARIATILVMLAALVIILLIVKFIHRKR